MATQTKAQLEAIVEGLTRDVRQATAKTDDMERLARKAENGLHEVQRKLDGAEQRLRRAKDAIDLELDVRHKTGRFAMTEWSGGREVEIDEASPEVRFLRAVYRILEGN